MKKTQRGFTLIELMIVLAVIGIMAAMFIPRYQDYIARTEVSEGVAMADAIKISIIDNLQNDSCKDLNADDTAEPNTTKGRYAEAVISGEPKDPTGQPPEAVNGCVVTINYGHGVDAQGQPGRVSTAIKDKHLVLNMLFNGSYGMDDKTDVDVKYLPKAILQSGKSEKK